MRSLQRTPQKGWQGPSWGKSLVPWHLLPPLPTTAGSPAVLRQHQAGLLLLKAGQEGAPLQLQPGQPPVIQNHCHQLPAALQQGTGILERRKDMEGCFRLRPLARGRAVSHLRSHWQGSGWHLQGLRTQPQRLEEGFVFNFFFKCHITTGTRPREPLLLTRMEPETHLGFLWPSAGLHHFYSLFEEQTSLLASRKQVLQTLQVQHQAG